MTIARSNGDIISFLKNKDYVMVNNNLGAGSFGKTVLLKDPFIDELFVAKKYEPQMGVDKDYFYQNFLDEIKILYKTNHHNIVRIFSYYVYPEIHTGYILMEFIDGKNIKDYIEDYRLCDNPNNLHPTPDEIFIQLIDAFCYLEDRHIIHRDIRESNILIDSMSGNVKVIDFGIGKILDPQNQTDSLRSDINRANAETLPQEYYTRMYTTQTDMFYIAELLNRLFAPTENLNDVKFSYQNIIVKMMKKSPNERYQNFAEIRQAIGKHDFINMPISEEDKEKYQRLSNLLCKSLSVYTSEPKFVSSAQDIVIGLQKVLKDNSFEDEIQNITDVIRCFVLCSCRYVPSVRFPRSVVSDFLDWFRNATPQSQELILSNLKSKLLTIKYEPSFDDVPF